MLGLHLHLNQLLYMLQARKFATLLWEWALQGHSGDSLGLGTLGLSRNTPGLGTTARNRADFVACG